MVETVDAGPIVGVELFPRPPDLSRDQLEHSAVVAALLLFRRLGPALANAAEPLPTVPAAWTGPTRTRADFARLSSLQAGLDSRERARRSQALGEASGTAQAAAGTPAARDDG